jgi:hypothetical protein
MRTSALSLLRGTPSVQSVHHYYYPFALELDGGRWASIAIELVDRLAVLVGVLRFQGMVVAYSCSLRYDSYVRTQHFVKLVMFLFGVFGGMRDDTFYSSSWYFGFLS